MNIGLPFREIIFLLIAAILLQNTHSLATVPIAAHQFVMVWSPARTSSTNPNSIAFTFPLSASYDSSYARYLVLAGFQASILNYVNFQLLVAGSTSTTQTVSLLPVNTNMGFFQVSFYVFCVGTLANNYLWVINQNYMCSKINSYNVFGGATSETVNLATPITIIKSSDFKVYPFVTWYDGQGVLGGQNPVKLDAQIFTGPSPPMVQITLSRTWNGNQLTKQVQFIVVLVNTTRLLYQNAPFFLGSSGMVANLGINAIFKSNTFSGLDGNCLIGIQKLQIGGNSWSGAATRSILFDAKLYPSLNPVKADKTGDVFSVAFSIACFNFAVPCANLTYFNPNTLTCGPCAIINCTTCLLYNLCQTCNQYSGWVPTAIQCQYCPNIAPGCLECTNSTYCMSCINTTYLLKNNSCGLCNQTIVGCYQCINNSYCLSCLNTSYVYNSSTYACPPCSSVLDHCNECTNFTVCISCAPNFFMNTTNINGSVSSICTTCDVIMPHCSQCSNNTVCEACNTSYYLQNNTCYGCQHFLDNCTTCSSQTVCTACVPTYYLSGTTCSLCIQDNSLCIQCINPQMCTICITGYYSSVISASNYACLPCTTLTNCLMCSDSVTCVQCQPTYLISGSVCLQCKDFLANCLTCDSSTYCTGCTSDYFYPHLGFCIPCSASILYCITCDLNATNNQMPVCTSCTYPLFLNNQSQCQTCASAISNCVLCTNETFCLECVNTSFAYDVSQNSCLPCPLLFQNCSKCTTTMCTQCQTDFTLINNNQNCTCNVGSLTQGVCLSIVGCLVPIVYPNKAVGCLKCDPSMFFVTPVYNHCQCLKGTLVGTVCSAIPNCISAIIALSGDIQCSFCNVNAGFLSAAINNIECICKPYFQSNGTYCNQICGDGYLMTKLYACDDGNVISGDGCSSKCTIEVGFKCQGGNTTSPSVCYYNQSKVTLALNQITKASGKNEAVFKFNVFPALSVIGKMDLKSNVHLTCDANYSVSDISYSSGQLTIIADYTSDLQGAQCTVDMSFDRNIVRSPSTTLKFKAKSSNYPLYYTVNLAYLHNLSFLFTLLVYITLGVFAVSLPHKMIGAELLVCCQIVYLSNCFYKVPSLFFSTVREFGLVTGDWAFFYKVQYGSLKLPFSSRVQITPQFLQNTIFVVSSFVAISIFWILLFVYLKRKQLCKKKENFLYTCEKLTLTEKGSKLIYRSFAFPFIVGLFMSLSIAGYVYNLRLQQMQLGHFSANVNCLAQLFVWIIVGITLAIEVCSEMVFKGSVCQQFVGVENAKQWYIPIFLIRTVILTVLIEVGITFTFDLILYGIAAVDLIYLFVIVIGRPYEGWCDRIGSALCVLVECYSIGHALASDFFFLSDFMVYTLILGMLGLLLVACIFGLIRLLFVYKEIIMNLCSKNVEKVQKKKIKKEIKDEYREDFMDVKLQNPFSGVEIKSQLKSNHQEYTRGINLTPLFSGEDNKQKKLQFQDSDLLGMTKKRLRQDLMKKKKKFNSEPFD